MLAEVSGVKQIKGEPRRRWFSEEDFDLIVWLDRLNRIIGFQLCYDIPDDERALTWKKKVGYTHHRVDSGERNRGHAVKATPVLVSDGVFEHARIAECFKRHSILINKRIAKFVYNKIMQYR